LPALLDPQLSLWVQRRGGHIGKQSILFGGVKCVADQPGVEFDYYLLALVDC
jgi:hypothetical protein